MQQTVNIPIQLISVCSTQGKLTPLSFRYEDENHEIITVKVLHTQCCRENHFVGINEDSFLCTALVNEIEHTFELNYNIPNHKWTLFWILS